jgi:DNA polymerase
MPPMDADQLRQYLEFYQDLGIKTLYERRGPDEVDSSTATIRLGAVVEPPADARGSDQSRDREGAVSSEGARSRGQSTSKSPAGGSGAGQGVRPAGGEPLLQILQDIGDCTRCRLHQGRHKIVFGAGHERSPLVFVGEGPGADEDAQGIPFVGRAGQLLTQMIEGTAKKEGIELRREDVYICNVVKCRPPDNRTPEPDEMEICGQFLYRQLTTIAPKAICVLGGTAAKAITGHKEGVTKMRGRWFQWRDIPVMVTYHPSFLLRGYNQEAKREAWEDLKKILHFVYD